MSANETELLPYPDGVAVIAAHFNVSDQTVRNWAETTDIPHRRIAGTLRFRLAEVDAWAARGGRPQASEEVA